MANDIFNSNITDNMVTASTATGEVIYDNSNTNITDYEEEQKQRDQLAEVMLQKLMAVNGPTLTPNQITALRTSLESTLQSYSVKQDKNNDDIISIQQENARILRMYADAKRIEGRSKTTLYNYIKELSKMFLTLNKSYKYITSNDIREYLAYRKDVNNLKPVSIANIRMYLVSFFKWMWREELIIKNPMDKIGVVKCPEHVVEVLTDEEQEIIRCACDNERDRAIIDLLSGSGMRVSELCGLNKSDINFDQGEVKVFGKGAKERICFLTGRSKVHLKWYLESRDDDNPALFVSLKAPHERLTKNGVEYILKNIAKKSKIPTKRLYPHIYRSTLATNMINAGADVHIVQETLGHKSVDTTLTNYHKQDIESIRMAHAHYVK